LYYIDYSSGCAFVAGKDTFVVSSHNVAFVEFTDCEGLELADFYAFWLGFSLEKLLLV
jgi:hypothetical protein